MQVGTSNVAATNFTYAMWVYESGRKGSSPVWAPSNTGYTIPLQTWTHLTLVMNSGSTLKLFANGVEVFSTNNSGYIVDGGSGGRILPVLYGANANDSLSLGAVDSIFNGVIDEAAIWNTALTPGEVQTLYQH